MLLAVYAAYELQISHFKRAHGKPSVVEQAVSSIGNKYGFHVTTSKDGRIFDSKDFRSYAGDAYELC